MKEKLRAIAEDIKMHPLYQSSNTDFPNTSNFTRYPKKHLPIIVEQAEKILDIEDRSENHYLCGKDESSFNEFIEKYIMDIRFFLQ